MITISAILILLLLVLISLNREVRDLRRENQETRIFTEELREDLQEVRDKTDRIKSALRHGAIMPDAKGVFRLMVPIRAVGGFADGEVRFTPIDDLPDKISFAWKDEHDGEHFATYQIGDQFTNGAHEARPVSTAKA